METKPHPVSCFDRYASPAERRITTSLIKAALDDGYSVHVHDGEELVLSHSRNLQDILDVLASTDHDVVTFWRAKNIGSLVLIWGNGEDLISDGTASMDIDVLVAKAGGTQ